jgi:SAM-dependent methyltransferase
MVSALFKTCCSNSFGSKTIRIGRCFNYAKIDSTPGGIVIHNRIQKLVYTLFGTSLVIGSPIKAQLGVLKARVPESFLHRKMDDLGCGDGKITLHLKEIFKPVKTRGFDIYPALIKRAKGRGIDAVEMDLETSLPKGELSVMWGVLHHLKDAEKCLKQIAANYPMAFIREPIKEKGAKGLEMGEPFIKEEVEGWVERHFPGAEKFYYGGCIFVFYSRA